jgi:glycosyltransferase involved in cell wall biosynthesis
MRIVLAVTTDLNFDQRMMRICKTLATSGYDVLLVGRKRKKSTALLPQPYIQKRLFCFFETGKLFYIEYNIRLFFYLLFVKMDTICAIDLDTILPCLFVSKIRRKKRVYDAHELFCEMDEIVNRPQVYKVWKWIEKFSVPKFKYGYTIGESYAEEFKKMYAVDYAVVRNATMLVPFEKKDETKKFILYQGAVNEGRCFEQLIPAMQFVDATLIVCGEGNFFEQAKQLAKVNNVESKIIFEGYVEPTRLKDFTSIAYIGITLFSSKGKSNYLSMANRFFDYMHHAVPQICMDYPEYRKANDTFEIALLLNQISVDSIAKGLNELLHNDELHQRLTKNCFAARNVYCWQTQEIVLKKIYETI